MIRFPLLACLLCVLGCQMATVAPPTAEQATLVGKKQLEDAVPEPPLLGPDALEAVAALPYPPANVAVSEDGRLFFTFMPQGNRGDVKVAEWLHGAVSIAGHGPAPPGRVFNRQPSYAMSGDANAAFHRKPKLMSESFAELFEQSLANTELRPGAIVIGTVVDITDDMVIVNAGQTATGSPGDTTIVIIDGLPGFATSDLPSATSGRRNLGGASGDDHGVGGGMSSGSSSSSSSPNDPDPTRQ